MIRPDLALYTPVRWSKGHAPLRVCWLDGDKDVQRQIEAIEAGPEGWSAACALGFTFGASAYQSDVRVTFTAGASWAYMGDWSPPAPAPTMQLGWLRADTNPIEVRRVWLHEAGHTLSFAHEHETTTALASIPWDWPGIEGWCKAHDVPLDDWKAEWLQPFAPEVIDQPRYDPASIMGYYIPTDWTLDRAQRGGATCLSAQDRELAAHWYGPSMRPPPTPPPPPKPSWRLYFPIGAR